MGNIFNRQISVPQFTKYDEILKSYYDCTDSSDSESVILYDKEHSKTKNINIDSFLDHCKKNLFVKETHIILDIENMSRWNFFDRVLLITLDVAQNKVCCKIIKSDNELFGSNFIIDFYDTELNNGKTIKRLLKKCYDAKFMILGNLYLKSIDFCDSNSNLLCVNTFNPFCTHLYKMVTRLEIELVENNIFSTLVLPNLAEITFTYINIFGSSFAKFFDNNPTIHTVVCKDEYKGINSYRDRYNIYYEYFINSAHVINLTIHYLNSNTMSKILAKNTVLEKLIVIDTHQECKITHIGDNFKFLETNYTCDIDSLKIIGQSQLIHVKCNHYCLIVTLLELFNKYPDSLSLSSLIKNIYNHYAYDQIVVKRSSNIINKYVTLEYLCNEDTVLDRRYYKN